MRHRPFQDQKLSLLRNQVILAPSFELNMVSFELKISCIHCVLNSVFGGFVYA